MSKEKQQVQENKPVMNKETKVVMVKETIEEHEKCPNYKKINTNIPKTGDSKLYCQRVIKVSTIFFILFNSMFHQVVS